MPQALNAARRRWCLAALALPLAGCVAAPYGTYYRPATAQPGARTGRGWCQGNAGPVTTLDIDLGGGMSLAARTERAGEGGVPLQVLLDVPPRTALHAEGLPLLRTLDGRPLAVRWSVRARRGVAIDPSALVDPQRLRPGAGPAAAHDPAAPQGWLTLRTVPLPAGLGERLELEGLALRQGDRLLAVPAVTLARPASPRQPDLYRSQAERAAVQARFEACRRDTPQRACENILGYSEDSDAGSIPGLRWRGRWERQRWSGGALGGELHLACQQPGPWRLEAGPWNLRDAAGGAVHPLRIASASLYFDDAVDLQTPMQPADAGTKVALDALLPADTPSFELVLPALLRDGERVAIAPLRFERRSLDVGVEPFNC